MPSRHLLAALLLQALALEAVLLQPAEESQAARSSGSSKMASLWERLRRPQRRAPQDAVRSVPQETELAEETQLVEETAAQDEKQKTEQETNDKAHTVMTEQRRAELKARWQARLKREAREKVLAAKADKMEADRVRVRKQAQLRADKAERLRIYEKKQAERRKAEAAEKIARERREAAKQQVQLNLAKAKAPATLRKVQAEAPAVEEEAPRSGSIRLNVIDSEDRGVQITVPKTARAQVLTNAALKRFGLDGSGAHFLHDGVELEASQPLEKYGLDDLDTIDVEMPY